jgi:hypothetical protein
MGTSTLLGYVILTNVDPYKSELNSAYAPTLFLFVINYTIGGLIMSVYGMACDTIL